MSKQAQILHAWFSLWGAVRHMLEIDLEPTEESQEIVDALVAMADDDLPAGSIKVGAPDEIRQTLDDLWASLGTPRAISAEWSE